ncbi:hypothetical protein ACF1G0_23925 [Streptomyces sp. NPDC013953]|uniref:hypothetical protein n=1 Tax=Streptomyces sp. NPDC013953 TaxID=3364868 RepID=UPI0036F60E15
MDAVLVVQRLAEPGVRAPRGPALIAYADEVAAPAGTPLTAVAPPERPGAPVAGAPGFQRHWRAGPTAGSVT